MSTAYEREWANTLFDGPSPCEGCVMRAVCARTAETCTAFRLYADVDARRPRTWHPAQRARTLRPWAASWQGLDHPATTV